MCAQLHHGRSGAAHVEDLNVGAVLVERAHVVCVARVERDAQQRRRRRAAAWRLVFGRGRLVQDRAVFETPQIERAQRAVRPDGNENVRRVGQPRHVVHLAVVRDQLRYRGGCVQVPHRTRRVDRRSDDETWHLLVPRKVGERRPAALALYLRLLWRWY